MPSCSRRPPSSGSGSRTASRSTSVLFEAFAAVREARKRESGQRLFDVQLMGGIVLHEGDIAEMKTGEGKTFVASPPLYLNALAGDNVHLVTVNDYLAKRDAEWNRPCSSGSASRSAAIENMMPFARRKEAYAADITYGTNSEFGFDYLRDNMAVSLEGTVQRGHTFAIVDEVDSILIDEARTPLIISGEPETAAKTYYDFARIVQELEGAPLTRKTMKGEDETELSGADYLYDEKFKTVSPAQTALDKVERALGIDNLYDPRNVQLVNHLTQALKAQSLYKRDVDYVVQDGEVKIVDEYTGRIMEGRRWSEGPPPGDRGEGGRRDPRGERHARDDHAAELLPPLREARRDDGYGEDGGEGVRRDLQPPRRRDPDERPGRPRRRERLHLQDEGREVGRGRRGHRRAPRGGQPVLVGTIAVETSEYLSELLKRRGIPHNVLNAKEHEREGEIIKDAGQPGAVTIATNMAGRGVDIKLGDGVVEAGGLYVLGTERHESRRIDNQLRGRSGRQGDPGETRFYLSAQDDLVRLFAGDRIHGIMERFKIPDDQPMEASILSRQIESAQKKVEEQNFVARKNVLKYDDVMNTQRMVIYEQRRRVLDGDDLSDEIRGWIEEVDRRERGPVHGRPRSPRSGISTGSSTQMSALYGTDITVEELREEVDVDSRDALIEEFVEDALDTYAEREETFGAGADARDRALRDPPDRRHALARAPRVDGLPARGRPPPRDGAEGPARRVPRRGARDVRGARRAIREEVVLTLFHVEVQRDEAGAAARSPTPGAAGI